MSLDLGELVGSLRMDVAPFDKALAHGDSALNSFAAGAAADAKAAGTEIGNRLAGGADAALSQLMTVLPTTAKGAVDKSSLEFQALSPALKKAVTEAENQANFDKLPAEAKMAMTQAEAAIAAGGDGAADEAKKAGNQVGNEFGDALKDKVKAAAAAAGIALGVGVADNLSLEQGRVKLAAQLGMTVEDSARLGKVAGKVYANNWGENRDEINTAIAAVMTSIKGMRKASDAELQGATETALAFADTFDIDVVRAVQTAGGLIRSGLAADSNEAFDLITKASSRVPAALREDVLDATDEYGQFFKSLGYDGPQAMALLVDGAKKGMYGIDKAGDAVKEFTIRSTDMSTSSKQAYKLIGLDARTMANDILAGGDRAQGATQKIIDGLLSIKDPAKQGQAAIALFGTPLEDLNTAQIPQFLKSLDGSSDSMKGWRDSAQQMGDTAGAGTANSIEAAKRQVIEWGRGVIESTGPTAALAGAVAAVGPAVLGVIGPISSLIVARSAQASAAAATASAETAASGSTVAAWLRSSAAATAGAIRTAAAWVLSGGAAVATYVASLAVAVAATVAGWVVMGAQALAQAARVAAAWLIAMGPIGLAIAAVVGIGIIIYKNWDNIKKWTGEAWDWVVGKVKAVPGLLVAYFMNFTLPGLIIKHWDSIKSGTSAAWGAITGFVKGIPGKMLGFFLQWNIVSIFLRHWDQMRSGAVSKGGAIVSWVAGLPGRLIGALGDLGGLLLSKGQQLIAGLQQGASNRIGAVVSWVQGIPGRITGAIPNPLGILSGIGGDIVSGLRNGISAAGHFVEEAVQAIINKIPKKIRSLMGISSPSKVMKALAAWIPAGIAAGIAGGTNEVTAAMATLTEKIDDQFTKDSDATEKRIKNKYDDLAKGIKKRLDGKAERDALDKNEKAQKDALSKAEKNERAKHKAVLDLIKAQQPAINANAAAQDTVRQKLQEQSDKLGAMRQQALDYAASVRDSFKSFGSITSVSGSDGDGSFEDLLTKRQAAATKAEQFAAAIDQLRGRLNENDLQDLIAKGPEALTLAQGIAAGGDTAIQQMNVLQARLQNTGQALGDRVADTLFTAGINSQQALVTGLSGDLSALEAAGTTLGNALLAAISKAMEGVGDAVNKGVDKGTKDKDKKAEKGGKNVGKNVEKGARDHLGVRSPSRLFQMIGGYVVDGMILGMDDKTQALESKVGDMIGTMTTAAGASLDVGLTASVAPAPVPQSPEVSRYAEQQAREGDTYNIYETTSAEATAAEVSRRQALAGAGA